MFDPTKLIPISAEEAKHCERYSKARIARIGHRMGFSSNTIRAFLGQWAHRCVVMPTYVVGRPGLTAKWIYDEEEVIRFFVLMHFHGVYGSSGNSIYKTVSTLLKEHADLVDLADQVRVAQGFSGFTVNEAYLYLVIDMTGLRGDHGERDGVYFARHRLERDPAWKKCPMIGIDVRNAVTMFVSNDRGA